MANAFDYYKAAYTLHEDLIPNLRTQIKLLNEVLELDKLQEQIDIAIKTGDEALIEQVKANYNDAAKTARKLKRKLIFWKTLAIGEAIVIVGVTGVVLGVIYL